jgi:Family of unknown function (DUF5681)
MSDTGNPGDPRGPRGQFRKGVSGNPGGRPRRHIGDLSREARKYASLALSTLVAICRKGVERNRLAAAAALLDRGYGRPIQMIDASIMNKKLSELTPAELATVEARLLSAAAERDDDAPAQSELFH